MIQSDNDDECVCVQTAADDEQDDGNDTDTVVKVPLSVLPDIMALHNQFTDLGSDKGSLVLPGCSARTLQVCVDYLIAKRRAERAKDSEWDRWQHFRHIENRDLVLFAQQLNYLDSEVVSQDFIEYFADVVDQMDDQEFVETFEIENDMSDDQKCALGREMQWLSHIVAANSAQ